MGVYDKARGKEMATPKMREDRLTHSPSTAVPSSIALAALRSPIRQYYKAQAHFCFLTQPHNHSIR